jgi:chaperonin GroES
MQVFTPASHPPEKNFDVVLVLRDEIKEKKSEGGIIFADRAVELANQGEVRAVSPKSDYQPGQRIVFTKYAGSTIDLNGVEYLLLQEREIQGTVVDTTVAEQEAKLQAALAHFERTQQG